ncbi:MAG: DMT family transporter [Reyranellales bacterium]
MTPTSQAWLGTAFMAGFALLSSTVGVFNRLIETDAWTMIFWRGLFGGLLGMAVLICRDRRKAWAAVGTIGWDGVVVVFCSALATVCFLNALRFTSVADVLVIHATMPFMTAGLAWLVIGEREDGITLGASVAAVLGVVIMVGPALADARLLGDLLAFGMAAFLSVMTVFLRKRRAVDMMPATGLSALACAAIVLPFAQPTAVDGWNFFLLVLFGAQFGLALLLLALGSRLVSATRTALFSILDTPLGPLWMWLVFGEASTTASLIGGAVVMAAVVADILLPRSKEAIHQPG